MTSFPMDLLFTTTLLWLISLTLDGGGVGYLKHVSLFLYKKSLDVSMISVT